MCERAGAQQSIVGAWHTRRLGGPKRLCADGALQLDEPRRLLQFLSRRLLLSLLHLLLLFARR